MSRIDELYEAAQSHGMAAAGYAWWRIMCETYLADAAPAPLRAYIALADPATVMALVEVYRAAKAYSDRAYFPHSIRAAIEKVEALG